MNLPDAEQLLAELTDKIRSDVTKDTVLVGIYTGGVWLAERLHKDLECILPLGTLDVSFYRDDFHEIGLHPQVEPSNIPFEACKYFICLPHSSASIFCLCLCTLSLYCVMYIFSC